MGRLAATAGFVSFAPLPLPASLTVSKPLLALCLLFCLCAKAFPSAAASCTEATLLGAWVTTWDESETWTFAEAGELLCDGFCDYGRGIGRPRGWAYEPHANVWSRPLDHLKLIFSERVFEGTTGAFRCDIEEDGKELLLDPMRGEVLRLQRR